MSAAMAEYLKSLVFNDGDAKSKETSEPQETDENKIQPKGMGDFDYETKEIFVSSQKYWLHEPVKQLTKQINNTKSLVITIEKEIAESVQDLHLLSHKIDSAEEVFPKRWGQYEDLKKECKDQCEQMSKEITKYTKKIVQHDCNLKNLDEKIRSWQFLIDKMKSEIPQPFGIPCLDNRDC